MLGFGSSNNTNGSSVSIQSNEAVEFNNVIFRENRTIVSENEGGWPAVYVGRGNVRFIQCQFIENSHTSDWAQVNGGVVSVNDWNHSGEIIFDQCLFKNNLAETKNTNNNYGAVMGSAIYWGNGKGKITNSIFESNRADKAVDEVPDDSDVISTAEGTDSSDSLRDAQLVSPTRFSPLIP